MKKEITSCSCCPFFIDKYDFDINVNLCKHPNADGVDCDEINTEEYVAGECPLRNGKITIKLINEEIQHLEPVQKDHLAKIDELNINHSALGYIDGLTKDEVRMIRVIEKATYLSSLKKPS